MKKSPIFILALMIVSSLAWSASEKFITLHTGDVYIFPAKNIERIAVGNDKVVQYRPLENGELLLTAGEQGVSDVHIWMKGERQQKLSVRVIAVRISTQLRSAQKLVGSIPGLKVQEVDNRLVFSGMINKSDEATAAAVIGFFPGSLNIAKLRQFDKAPLVRLDVRIIEVNSSAAKELGIDWQKVINGPVFAVHKAFDPSITGGGYLDDPNSGDLLDNFIEGWPANDSSFYSYGGFTSAFTSRISLLVENGDASILATPKLSVKSGETADFHSGGEFPIPYRDINGQMTVSFKEYGVRLNVTPTIDNEGVIDATVYTEVSSIDFANEVLDVPGVTTRNTETRINLLSGDTLVISGLAYSEISNNESKVPLLGDIPGIKKLFTKKGDRVGSRELIISVTPIVIDAKSQKNRSLLDISDEFAKRYKKTKINSALME